MITSSQNIFVKNESCQTNSILFFDRVTTSADEENAVDIIYLDFSKASDTVQHDIFISRFTTRKPRLVFYSRGIPEEELH